MTKKKITELGNAPAPEMDKKQIIHDLQQYSDALKELLEVCSEWARLEEKKNEDK